MPQRVSLTSQEPIHTMSPITVVIPTFNRAGKIAETLDALCGQTFQDFNVIVIDDGSTDNTVELLQSKKENLSYPLDIILQQNSGASAATNNGITKAGSGLIILLDDDIIAAPDMIQKHFDFHSHHHDSILSGTAETDPDRSITDVQRYKWYMEQQWKKIRPLKECIKVNFDNFIITTANMSFPYVIFKLTGGFDTSLRDGYDVDFGFRALLKNIPLYFDTNVKSIHNDQINLRYYARRQKAYTQSKKIIFTKFPELKGKYKTDFELRISPAKVIVYYFLRSKPSVLFFESNFFAKVFPKFIRYRVYGSTIAALSLKN
ncbi:hypothetical protein BH09BAC5_BH09BAC5_28170 [soil metagenome]